MTQPLSPHQAQAILGQVLLARLKTGDGESWWDSFVSGPYNPFGDDEWARQETAEADKRGTPAAPPPVDPEPEVLTGPALVHAVGVQMDAAHAQRARNFKE